MDKVAMELWYGNNGDVWYGEMSESSSEEGYIRNPDGRRGTPKCRECRQKKTKVSITFFRAHSSVRGTTSPFHVLSVERRDYYVVRDISLGKILVLEPHQQKGFCAKGMMFFLT
jgi:hypothetical protein